MLNFSDPASKILVGYNAYTFEGLCFECSSLCATESKPHQGLSSMIRPTPLSRSGDRKTDFHLYNTWTYMLAEYTRYELTRPEDKLADISTVGRQMIS